MAALPVEIALRTASPMTSIWIPPMACGMLRNSVTGAIVSCTSLTTENVPLGLGTGFSRCGTCSCPPDVRTCVELPVF